MSSSINNPHDKFFKQLMSDKKNARDFLEIALPQEVVKILDLQKLENDSKSYVNKKYREYFTDLVLKTQTQSETPLDVYILLEHKSYPEVNIHLQLLGYMLKMWEKDAKDKKPLRPIIPLVFYHGTKDWKIPQDFEEVFKLSFSQQESLRKYIPKFSYELFNTSSQQMDKIKEFKSNLLLQSSLVVMSRIMGDAKRALEDGLKVWQGNKIGKEGAEDLVLVLNYLVVSGNIERKELEESLVKLEQGDIMPTLAQRWMEEGKEQGMRQGILEGKREGNLEAKRQMLLSLLEARFGKVSKSQVRLIEKSVDLAKLEQAILRVITAVDVEEVLGELKVNNEK